MKHYVIQRISDNLYMYRGIYRQKYEGFDVYTDYQPEVQWAIKNNDKVRLIQVQIIIS